MNCNYSKYIKEWFLFNMTKSGIIYHFTIIFIKRTIQLIEKGCKISILFWYSI